MRSSAEHSIMQELGSGRTPGFCGAGFGQGGTGGMEPKSVRRWICQEKNCGSAAEPRQRVPRDAILDVAAARRRARIPATTVAAIVRMVPAPPRPPRSSSGPKPSTLHRGSHDIRPGPGTPQEPHAVPAGTSARGQLGRVGMGQRRSDRRAVPSRYAGRRRCNSRHRSPGYLLAGCGGRAVWRVGDNSLMWMGQRYGVRGDLSVQVGLPHVTNGRFAAK